MCDGIVDCPDGDDEAFCDHMACPGHLRCSHTTFCVPPHEICDGEAQCPLEEDEKFCMLCSIRCACRGNIIACNNLDVINLLASPAVLILNNSISAFYQIEKNMPNQLEKLFCLRLNHGKFYEIFQTTFSPVILYRSLRWLQLNNQGIKILYTEFVHGPLMRWLDLSFNFIHSVKHQTFTAMKHIEVLNLNSNKLASVQAYYFEHLKNLKFLYLQGNPLMDIASQVLQNCPDIRLIRSNWYMLCCAVHQVKDCEPKGYLVSSCESLFSSVSAKVFITVQAVFAIFVNGVILCRLCFGKCKSPDLSLMISLVSADIMMGIYLLMLSITDLYTSGVFHLYIVQWTQSYVCLAAGILNFVSSEASLIILASLSVATAISIQKVGGMKVMKNKIVYASVCLWVFIFSLAILYTVVFELGAICLRNNMCIILGISHHHFVSAAEYIFQILLISLNSVCLFVIFVCALSIFAKAYLSYKSLISTGSSHSNHVIRKIGIRLMLLLFFNFVCWIPVLCVAGLMLTAGNIHENVIIWMAIISLPISATTDPFLYNIHLLRIKQNET